MHNIFDYDALQRALDGPFKMLTHYRQWMLWRLEPNPNGGKPRKYPYSAYGGSGSSTNPETWTDAATALATARQQGMGLAFVLTESDPFVFIDVDGCVTDDGQWNADALDTFARFPGAAFEVSQSRRGMHLFVSGKTPDKYGRITSRFECYPSGRFVALTGINAQGAIYDYGDTLLQFVNDKFPPVRAGANAPLTWTTEPIPEWNGPTDDDELLRQFLNEPAPIGASEAFAHLAPEHVKVAPPAFASNADLFNANVDVLARAYPADNDIFDHSAAAFALATRLAYWTGKNCERMQRLMDRAAFRRAKAYEQHDAQRTYMQWDIERACSVTNKVRYQRVAALNAEVVEQRNEAHDSYVDQIAAAAGNSIALRAVADQIANDSRPDEIARALLAAELLKAFKNSDMKVSARICADMVRRRVAGVAYDLKKARLERSIALNAQHTSEPFARDLSLSQMLDEFVFVANGTRVMSISHRNLSYKETEFTKMYAACTHETPDGKIHKNAEDWLEHKMRMSRHTRTFRAGHKEFTTDPDGIDAINTWRPRDRAPVMTMDIAPFLEHIQFLFGDDAEPFLDWLAHIEQFPGDLPHYGWLHVAPKMGTGRGWLSAIMSELWVGYVAPSVDLASILAGGFNGLLSGRVLAIVDEVRAGAGENAYTLESKLRSIVTERTRSINAKYGGQFLEFNACRWFVCSNHMDALPMPAGDRRWWVTQCTHDTQHPDVKDQWAARFVYLYDLAEMPQFIESIAAFLRARDLSHFNPGDRPPVNDAKAAAINEAKSEFMHKAEQIVRCWPADLITTADLLNILNDGDRNSPVRKVTPAMKHALQDAGMKLMPNPMWVNDNDRLRCWAVRNFQQWRIAAPPTTKLEFAKVKPEIGGAHALLLKLA